MRKPLPSLVSYRMIHKYLGPMDPRDIIRILNRAFFIVFSGAR